MEVGRVAGWAGWAGWAGTVGWAAEEATGWEEQAGEGVAWEAVRAAASRWLGDCR